MQNERYPYENVNHIARFEFESVGPKGPIKKIINYNFLEKLKDGTPVYNLGFGDYNGDEQDFNDLTISNNDDRNKILATVANTVLDFSRHFENVVVYARGSTPSRTRLYQISIAANLEEIEKQFLILGLQGDHWAKFKKGINYEAFSVTRKN
jgi:hypothetical protein